MKWIFPSTCYAVAAYMWKINQSNSNSMIAVGTAVMFIFIGLEIWDRRNAAPTKSGGQDK